MKIGIVIRKIYLYVATLIGLVMLIIGCVGFINMALRTFVFTEIDKQEELNYKQPTMVPEYIMLKETQLNNASSVVKLELTKDQADLLKQNISEYKAWKERQDNFDYIKASRQRQAASNLALVLVGFPLYLYHWLIVRRENRKEDV